MKMNYDYSIRCYQYDCLNNLFDGICTADLNEISPNQENCIKKQIVKGDSNEE